MAASRSSRVTRSSVGLNGLDENFCGRTLRNRSIAQPEETPASPLPRARSPKKKQESKQQQLQQQESKQQDSKQQESKQDSKQDTKDDSGQDAKDCGQDCGQDSRSESKQDAKQNARQDERQNTHSQQTTLHPAAGDAGASPAEADQWTSSRKRTPSCIERDASPDGSENRDKGKRTPEAFPPIKRAKRCSRSGESQGQEDAPQCPKPDSPLSGPQPGAENSCDEPPGLTSDPASPVPGRPAAEPGGRTAEDGLECDGANRPPNDHKASNGLGDGRAEDSGRLAEEPLGQLGASPASAATCPSLPNGSETGAPPFPDPAVPSTNSAQTEVSGGEASPASPAAECGGAPAEQVPELLRAREAEPEEVEVDVVGDPLGLAHQEQVAEDANGRTPTPGQEAASSFTVNMNSSPINSNSGETTPPLTKSPSPTEPISNMSPSFTELYEHRYTLRTSPRRAASGGKASSCSSSSSSSSSSSKPSSPPRDNGPLKEEGGEAGLREDGPTEEEPAPSDSVGPSVQEPVSVNPGERGSGEGGGAVGGEAELNQNQNQNQAAEEEEEEEEEEEPDVYYFESDHLALKHNKDYQRLLQTIGVLEAQRTQAILDLETLARHQRQALSDPIGFVEQLQKQVNLGLPCPQRVVQLPDIGWEQYTSGLGDFEREFCDKKRKTRRLKLIFDKAETPERLLCHSTSGLPARPKSPVEPKKEGESSTVYSSLPTSDAPENGRQAQMIRGRICHPNKPDTFNQLWTVEEQRKLEQLLVKFPPEEVESRRWQKIADELGNRTAKQVASRVQKYFIKLTKAGIPVPGRTPNLCMYTKKASSKRQHHLNKHLYRPSTFLTSYEPPVYMDEDDEHAALFNSVQDPSADDSDEDSIPLELRNLPEYKELLELKRLKKHRLQEIQEDSAAVRHVGFKCDVCGVEPIQGVRWHCQDCPPNNSVDFCSNCSDCLLKTDTHQPDHQLEPLCRAEGFLDRDYCLPPSAGYNYLDPNYFPANR